MMDFNALAKSVRFYIGNAFSIQMLEGSSEIRFVKLSREEAREFLDSAEREGSEIISAIGHADMAGLVSDHLGREVKENRTSIKLDERSGLIVAQYSGARLPEGTTSLPPGAKVEYWLVWRNQ